MKTVRTLFLTFLISLIFCGCDSFLLSSNENKTSSAGKAVISISVNDGHSRTAMPVFNWSDFTYELIAVQNPGEPTQKDAETLFTNKSYDNLIQGISLDVGRYKFTLNAYKDSQKVLSGSHTVDLSSGNTTLSFLMYPVTGGKGSASISITYPQDSPVAKIVAFTSDEIFDEKEGVELTGRVVSGKMRTEYKVSELPSDKEQYAIIKFYDSNHTLVYSCTESLIILAGVESKSSIELTDDDWHTYSCVVTLKKDGEGWTSSKKTVSLVNKTNHSKVYPLEEYSKGAFGASVAEGIYYVYVNGENTEIEFNSINEKTTVDYYTVSMGGDSKGCKMIPVSGGLDQSENLAVVQKGKDFVYQISLSRGYEVENFTVKENGNIVPNASFDENLTIESVSQKVTITTEGNKPIIYTITYKDGANGAEFAAGKVANLAYWYEYGGSYTPQTEFTAEDTVLLPAIGNIRKDNNFFDAWTDEKGKTIIDTEGIYENLELYANWRPAPFVDDVNQEIYANGFNLLIKGSDTQNSITEIYVDYNGDGIKNQDDYQITCTNISTSKSNDFTGYTLKAGSNDGSYVPKSDFTFTMTGGRIAAIYGLNTKTQKYPNKSTLNISGTAQIGLIEGKKTTQNDDSTFTTRATSVKGIMLDTLSAERVFITGQMTNLSDAAKSPYSVTCVSENMYDIENEHVVAEIINSNYATLANFTCWNVKAGEDDAGNTENKYTQILLAHKEELINSVTKTFICMADDSGVVLPKAHEIVWDEDEFHLGDQSIKTPCSVFSLSVENGTFRVNQRTTITKNKTDNDIEVEKSLTYMAQPTPLTYVEHLEFEKSYVYMQVLSSADLLTPEIINNFLKQIYFKKIDETKDVKVTVNIETVPAKFILGNGDGHGGSEFKYFDGSFYKRFQYENDTPSGYNGVKQTSGSNSGKILNLITWTTSYNKAKQATFNGLKGYLMNITSEVENNYIYDTFHELYPDQLSWAGGATFAPVAKTTGMISGKEIVWWDQDVTSSETDAATPGARKAGGKWCWQAGPEAGMCFWSIASCDGGKDGTIEGVFERWNNATLHKDVYTPDIDSTDPTKLIKGSAGAEPNGTATGEPCLQFLAGRLTPSGKDYYANGFWNNQGDSNTQASGYGCTGYIVEFTPYETDYGIQVANYQAIRRTSVYGSNNK